MSNTPDRLSLLITHADGSTTRWGPDEIDNQDVPTGLTFTTTLPGGDADCTCSLFRRIDHQQPDENLFDDVQVIGPGAETVWHGRMSQFPRAHGDTFTTHPGAEGWSAHLSDQMFREIYVDCDKSQWHDPSAARRQAIIAAGYNPSATSVDLDEASASSVLRTSCTGAWGTASRGASEALYDAKGITIGSLYYAWQRGTNIYNADTNWSWGALLTTDDALSAYDSTGSLRAAGPSSGTLTATTATRKYAAVQLLYATSGGTDNTPYDLSWTCLAVYGNHGLTKRGTADYTLAPGFYASDIIADAIRRGAPQLAYSTTGTDPTIQATSLVISQAVFTDPENRVRNVIEKANGGHLWDWVVYNKTFYFRPPDPSRLTWKARVHDGAKLSLDGLDSSDVYSGVVVRYTDAQTGTERCVGPPGSGASTEDASLATDTDAATAHGLTRHYTLSLSDVATEDFAIAVGAVYLAEHLGPQRRGQAVLTGRVEHPTAGPSPVWRVRAGDYIDFVDTQDNSLGGPRRVVGTSYDNDAKANTITLDNSAYTTEALLQILSGEIGR